MLAMGTTDTTTHTHRSAWGDHREDKPTSHRITMPLRINLMYTIIKLQMGVVRARLILVRHHRVLGPMGPVDIFGSRRCRLHNHPLGFATRPCSRALNRSRRLKALVHLVQSLLRCLKARQLHRQQSESQYRSAPPHQYQQRQRHSRKNRRKRKGRAGSSGEAVKAKRFGK